MNMNITKVSSKGQVVIPQDMRKGFEAGSKLVVIRNDKQLIFKKVEDFDKNLEEDLEFAKRTEEAYKRIENGGGTTMKFDDFIEEMKKW